MLDAFVGNIGEVCREVGGGLSPQTQWRRNLGFGRLNEPVGPELLGPQKNYKRVK